jgi:hypothetical protein
MDKLTRNTIKFVNGVRNQLGLDPVKDLEKGRAGMIYSCPIAKTIQKDMPEGMGASAYSTITITHNGVITKTIPTPTDVMDWIRTFDNGRYMNYRLAFWKN